MISYKINTSTYNDIYGHLRNADNQFIPKLSSIVVLEVYAKKILQNATNFEAWDDKALVGLIACYINDPKNETAYITNVSVEANYQNRSVAKTLIEMCVKECITAGFKRINLEVQFDNIKAIRLYEKFGFVSIEQKEHLVVYSLEL